MVEVSSPLILGSTWIYFLYVSSAHPTALSRQPGLGHSVMTVAAHASRADGITQPQLTPGRWESLTPTQARQPVPLRPGPGWPHMPQNLCPQSTGGSGALSMKNWLIFLFIPSSRLKGQREGCQCMALPQRKTINSLVFLFVPLLSQNCVSDERDTSCLLQWTPLAVGFTMITAIWDPGTSP